MTGKPWRHTVHLLTVLTFLLVFVVGTQYGSAEQKNLAFEIATPNHSADVTELIKETAWNAYEQILVEIRNSEFPINPAAAKRMLDENSNEFLIIDMRSPADYKHKHIKGAVRLHLVNLADNLDKLPQEKTLMLYCYTGQTSALAMVPLKAYGVKAVFVNGGFDAIERAGFEMSNETVSFEPGPVIQASNSNRAAALAGIKTNLAAIARQHLVKTLVIANSDVQEIVAGMPTKYAFVDLRPREDYDKEHIKGAISAPLLELRQHIPYLPREKRLILCCKSGQLASMATAPLTAEGFKIITLCAGLAGTEGAKFPTECHTNE